MRCNLLKNGRIDFVELLQGADDNGLVAQGRQIFESKGKPRGAQGFEVWNGPRLIYRWPSEH